MAFDLSKKGGSTTDVKSDKPKTVSLDGFTELSKDQWTKEVLTGNRIKYMSNGTLKAGGYVVSVYESKQEKTKGKMAALLKSPSGSKWQIIFDNVDKIYLKEDSKTPTTSTSVKEIPLNIQNINHRITSLENEVSSIKEELHNLARAFGNVLHQLRQQGLVKVNKT